MSWCHSLVQIMADRGGPRGDRGRGDRGRGRGPRRPRGKKDDEEKWVPCTKLGRLVQQVGYAGLNLCCHASMEAVRS